MIVYVLYKYNYMDNGVFISGCTTSYKEAVKWSHSHVDNDYNEYQVEIPK
ncbi:hypothetical protein UFOVP59_41 [uncultured Caudovirales phage]|uniref:Uncharacterized protein n=1 Tax=uncultured Caudovirales phage TaxID=2100421 RepID=A0A6J5KS28_9CAUD|nr:hypothetical protein UFOVP59_41 [uncultured Caudovirales phage]CAB5221041.1 hypothetical protein UFOVP246_74 [uncultured Caudovirales phage]